MAVSARKVTLKCPRCGTAKVVDAPSEHGIYKVNCDRSDCGGVMRFAVGQKPRIVVCGGCGARMALSDGFKGSSFKCPKCGALTAVPAAPKAPASKPEGERPKGGSVPPPVPAGVSSGSRPIVPRVRGNGRYSAAVNAMPAQSRGMGLCELVSRRYGGVATRHPLHGGRNIVGRRSMSCPSDVSIDGDDLVSRQSLAIDVEMQPAGCSYTVVLMRSTNPVYLNGRPLMPAVTMPLRPGDTLTLGNTSLTLTPV